MGRHPTAPRALALLLAVVLAVVACEPDDGDPTPPTTAEDTEADTDPPEDEEPAATAEQPPSRPDFREDDDCFGRDRQAGGDDGFDTIVCGYVSSPLHHAEPDGATVELAVVTYEGRASAEHDRPLVVLGGGPGEAMVEPFLAEPAFRELLDIGPDLIVMDQRGVGASEPALECPQVFDDPEPGLTPLQEADAFIEDLLGCRERLADDGIDLGAFNHLDNAADVDVVRRALGHDEIDVRGTSYGSQVAQLAAQMQPETIGAVVLSSPVDPTRNWVELAPAGIHRALREVAAACEQDAGCAEAFGDVDELIDATAARLDDEPAEVEVDLPDIEATTLTYTPARFLGGLSLLFYVPDGAAAVPAFAAAAADGDLSPIAELTVTLEQQIAGALSVGMQYSMLCAGEGGLVTEQGLRAGTDDGPIEEYWIPENIIAGDRLAELCDEWDVLTVYDPDAVTIDHDVPTLIITGEFDHVTPPELGESLARQLDDHVLIEVPAAGHGPLEALGPCGAQIAAGFLLDPTTAPDDTCATAREIAFVGGPAASGP